MNYIRCISGIILGSILASSCRPLLYSDLRIDNDPIEPKLPAMSTGYGSFSGTISYSDPCACELNLISEEVASNLTEQYGTQYGYISFKVRTLDLGFSFAFLFPTFFSLGTLNLLGMPLTSYVREIELEVELIDSKRQLLKKYSAKSRVRVYSACYWGYRERFAAMKIYPDAFNGAMAQIRAEVKKDAKYLREKLLEAGPNTKDD